MTGVRWVEAGLAAVATLASAWAVTGLLAAQVWVLPTVVTLAAVAVAGILARALPWPRPAVVATQALLGALVISWLLLPGHHWFGLPLPTALGEAGRLAFEGVQTIRTESVPAPATDGLVLLVVAGLAAVAVAVDALAVTYRAPAAAGLPLLVVCTVTASNTGEPLHPRYFLAAAAAWLLLVARHGSGTLLGWAPAPDADVRAGLRRHRTRARVLGVSTVVLAVLVPMLLPHLPPTTMVQGLSQGDGDGSGQVTFTETLDLSEDLASRSARPVIRYRTDDPRPGPLRVAVSTTYRDGRWEPRDRDLDESAPSPALPRTAGDASGRDDADDAEDAEDADATRTMTVVANALRAPQVAVPHPLVGADFGDIPWGVDPTTGTVMVADQPQSYEAAYLPTAGRLPPEGDGADAPLTEGEDGTVEELRVDPASREMVTALAQELTAGADDAAAAAQAIQAYLRSSAFTYSLTLADPDPGGPLDPVSHFLSTRQGYCTQFATAMVMLARASGIPARLAVGFLPGQRAADGSRTVVAADAHAWPELAIDGLGWTRFEPTPGVRSGVAPTYLAEEEGTDPAEVPTEERTVAAPQAQTATQDPATAAGSATEDDWWDRNGGSVRTALGAGGVLLLVASTVPLAGWWRRRGTTRGAPGDVVEAQWQRLVTWLADLGVEPPRGATPRAAAGHYEHTAGLTTRGTRSLARVTDAVERARYGAGAATPGGVAADVTTVLREARRHRPPRLRARALLWPASGREQLSRWMAALRPGRRRARGRGTTRPHARGVPRSTS